MLRAGHREKVGPHSARRSPCSGSGETGPASEQLRHDGTSAKLEHAQSGRSSEQTEREVGPMLELDPWILIPRGV